MFLPIQPEPGALGQLALGHRAGVGEGVGDARAVLEEHVAEALEPAHGDAMVVLAAGVLGDSGRLEVGLLESAGIVVVQHHYHAASGTLIVRVLPLFAWRWRYRMVPA